MTLYGRLGQKILILKCSEESYCHSTMFFNRQRTTKLILGGNSVRAQKAFALDYCASAFVTEGKQMNSFEKFKT